MKLSEEKILKLVENAELPNFDSRNFGQKKEKKALGGKKKNPSGD